MRQLFLSGEKHTYKWKWSSTLNVCACAVNTWTTYRYIHTYIYTYIHKYSDFLVAMISVGLAQARPNYDICKGWVYAKVKQDNPLIIHNQ